MNPAPQTPEELDGATAECSAEAQRVSDEVNDAFEARGFVGVVDLLQAHSDDPLWQFTGFDVLLGELGDKYDEDGVDMDAAADAGAAGAVEAVVSALRSFLDDTLLTVLCVDTLTSLLQCTQNVTRACAAGAPEALAGALPTLKLVGMKRCAASLSMLVELNPAALTSALTVAAVPALAGALRSALDTEHFYSLLTAVIGWLSVDGAAAHGFRAAGAFETVAAGFRAHPADVKVQSKCCTLLHYLLDDVDAEGDAAPRVQNALRKCGVLEAVLAAIRTHCAEVEVQSAGCHALSKVCRLIRVPKGSLHSSGIVDAVLAAMRAHPTAEIMQLGACFVLVNVLRTASPGDTDQVAAGVLVAVLAAWRTHIASPAVVGACIGALLFTVKGTNMRHAAAAVVSAGAGELALATIRAHPAATDLQSKTYNGLAILMAKCDPKNELVLAKRLLVAGALRPLGLDSESRRRFLTYLQELVDSAEDAAERAAAELLAAEEKAASSKKKSRSKKKGGAAAAAAAGASGSGAGAASEPSAGDAEGDVDDAAAPDAPAPPEVATASEPSAGAVRRRRRAATKAARRTGDAPAAAASDGDSTAAEPDAAAADADAAAATDAPAAADPPAAAAGAASAQLLGDIFPWLLIAPEAAAVAPPVLPPLPLAAQPQPQQPQQPAAPAEAEHAAALAELARVKAELEARNCAICLDAPKCTVLLPCRHLALCGAPACAAMLGAPPLCPLCRKGVADTMQLFV